MESYIGGFRAELALVEADKPLLDLALVEIVEDMAVLDIEEHDVDSIVEEWLDRLAFVGIAAWAVPALRILHEAYEG